MMSSEPIQDTSASHLQHLRCLSHYDITWFILVHKQQKLRPQHRTVISIHPAHLHVSWTKQAAARTKKQAALNKSWTGHWLFVKFCFILWKHGNSTSENKLCGL